MSQRRGFTLVELLVVIAIIGILVALLLPAVQAAREAGRRSSCSNNSKQIGIGFHNYHDTYKIFPPAGLLRVANPPNFPTCTGQTGLGLPWAAHILPFIEQQPLYNQIQGISLSQNVDWQAGANQPVWSSSIPIYKCPSDGFNAVHYEESGARWARGNYGANLGKDFSAGGSGGPGTMATIYKNQNGAQRGPLGWQQSGGLNAITDGTSNTVLIWELRSGTTITDVRGTWGIPRVGANAVSGCSPDGDCYGINSGNSGNDDVHGCTDAWQIKMGCWSNGDGQGGPKSLHPGGVHGLLGDASTRFISQSIDNNTLKGISSASGGETVGDF
jgi:prepilin-type N-terminal cleavage/methylation domain-containing protein